MKNHLFLILTISSLIIPSDIHTSAISNNFIEKQINLPRIQKIVFRDNDAIIASQGTNHSIINLLTKTITKIKIKVPEEEGFYVTDQQFEMLEKNHPNRTFNLPAESDTKKLFCITTHKDDCPEKFYVYDSTDNRCIYKNTLDSCFDFQFSPDDSTLIYKFNATRIYKFEELFTSRYNTTDGHVINIQSGIASTFLKGEVHIDLKAMRFHPHNNFLVTLSSSSPNNLIQFWNTKTYQCFANHPIDSAKDKDLMALTTSDCLAISPDGTRIAIALPTQCLVIKIPFATIGKNPYPLDTKQTMLFLLWTLNLFQHNNTPLPKEIIQLLIQKTLKTLRLRTGLSHG